MQPRRNSPKENPSTQQNTQPSSQQTQHNLMDHRRSPKLEVSFLLNQAHGSSSATPQSEYSQSRNSSAITASAARQRADKRSQGSSAGQRRYRCEFCPSTFAQSHDALKHKRTVHEKLRPFRCDLCSKSFGEKGNLSKHKRSVHFNERPFLCDLCPSSFAFKDGLQRHRSLVHLDHRPFVCNNCGADFKQVSQLRKHTCGPAGSSSRGRS